MSDYSSSVSSMDITTTQGSDNQDTADSSPEVEEVPSAWLTSPEAQTDWVSLQLIAFLLPDLHAAALGGDSAEGDEGGGGGGASGSGGNGAARLPLNQLTWVELARWLAVRYLGKEAQKSDEDVMCLFIFFCLLAWLYATSYMLAWLFGYLVLSNHWAVYNYILTDCMHAPRRQGHKHLPIQQEYR